MDKFDCRYAIIQFRPFVETEEFANIGVVLACPSTGYFDYRIQLKQTKRFTDFFRPLPREGFLEAAKYFEGSLRNVKAAAHGQPASALRAVFERLVHPRETMIRFSEPRALLTSNPPQELDRLYSRLVHRDFATRIHVEEAMTRELVDHLRTLNLAHPFKAEKIGDDFLSVKLPLVQTIGSRLVKGIKPLNLNLQDPNEVFDKGAIWASRYDRLRNQLPEQVAFVLEMPTNTSDIHVAHVAWEAADALERAGAVIIPSQDQNRLDQFAMH